MTPLTLRIHRAAGDLIVFTAAVHSLLDQYPEYSVSVESKHQALLDFDPNLSNIPGRRLQIDYVRYMQDGSNYAEAYCKGLSEQLKRPVRLTREPKLFLSDGEKEPFPDLPDRYFVFNAGSKPDMPVKQIPLETAEQVVSMLDIPCIQIGLPQHNTPIKGAVNLIGKTNLRETMQVAAHAIAGWGGDTFLFHCCCALGTPYVLCASGRMPPYWLDLYHNQTTLTAHGTLSCCETRGCMMRRVVPIRDGSDFDKMLCSQPRLDMALPVAECMTRITAEQIVEGLAQYLS